MASIQTLIASSRRRPVRDSDAEGDSAGVVVRDANVGDVRPGGILPPRVGVRLAAGGASADEAGGGSRCDQRDRERHDEAVHLAGNGSYETLPAKGRVSFLPSNVIVIVPRSVWPLALDGTLNTHTAWPPTNFADAALSVLLPTFAVHGPP
jgi:hypothetical protein